jgi:RNA polymerase sigma-70 factor, ECF subfamily
MDDELIAALAAGDDTALRELFTRHAPWLATRLLAALPLPDVEDVLQETFLAVWKGASAYRPQGTPRAWMWVIARNQAALLLRRRGPAAESLPEVPQAGLTPPKPPSSALRSQPPFPARRETCCVSCMSSWLPS